MSVSREERLPRNSLGASAKDAVKERRLEEKGCGAKFPRVASGFDVADGGIDRQVAKSFTLDDIDAFIEEAEEVAAKAQGSHEGRIPDDSQLLHENLRTLKEGSKRKKEKDSQFFHQAVSERLARFWDSCRGDCTIGCLGGLVGDILMICELSPSCRPGPIAGKPGKKGLFPLPASGSPLYESREGKFLQAIVLSLNSMHGTADDGRAGPSSFRVVKRLHEILEGSCILGAKLPEISFGDLFLTKGVDYQGEEVRLARKLVWPSVEPSLPTQVGALDLRDFCEGGVLYYVNHFPEFLFPPQDQIIGRPPLVMVDADEWPVVAQGLLDRGICTLRRRSQLHHVGHQALLSGLFAVSKEEYQGPVELSRLIMNLKPLNVNCRSLEGDTCTLPSVTQLASVSLDDDEILVTSSEDLRCYFYLFSVPEAWVPFLGFGRVAPSCVVPEGSGDEDWFLCARVLPMGFLNSVGIAQHIHRNVVRRCVGSLAPPVGGEHELRRDRFFSSSPDLYRVYLDNFDQLCKVDRHLYDTLVGTPSELAKAVREAYDAGGLPRNPKKTVMQQSGAEVQGAWLDGDRGTLCAKPAKIAKYVRLALELLQRGTASQKELQIVGGGLVYISMFKRPLLGSLNQIWRTIVALDDLPKGARRPLPREVIGRAHVVHWPGPTGFLQS